MYTILGPADGPVTFRTHVAVSELEPNDASRILELLRPMLERLEARAAEVAPRPAPSGPIPASEAASS